MPEHLWERQEGESAKAFAAFEGYRRLGPARTVEEAWRQYWHRPGPHRPHPDGTPPPRVMPYFAQWSRQYRWGPRAAAWDAEQAESSRDAQLDHELQARAAEQEEDRRQRGLMKEEARAARAVGRRILLRLLQAVEAGQLDRLGVPDLLPHLQKVATLLEAGQKLERLERGEVTDRTETQVSRDGLGRQITVALREMLEAKEISLQALAAVRDDLEAMEP